MTAKHSDKPCDDFLKWALPRMDMRWEGFRKVRGQVCKRLRRRMNELGINSFNDYKLYLLEENDEWQVADQMMRITISRFFRDKYSWTVIENQILPEITTRALENKRPVRCWSAGCASGEEPYSLAILWKEKILPAFPGARFEVLATDSDPFMLKRAVQGCYIHGSLKEMLPELKERAFSLEGSFWCLKEEYRRMVSFELQDIRKELPDGPFDIVFCKNLVAMYFSKEMAIRIFRQISEVMRTGSYLLLGNHETIAHEEIEEIDIYNRGVNIYVRN